MSRKTNSSYSPSASLRLLTTFELLMSFTLIVNAETQRKLEVEVKGESAIEDLVLISIVVVEARSL